MRADSLVDVSGPSSYSYGTKTWHAGFLESRMPANPALAATST